MGIKFSIPWKTLIIKFPPPRDGKAEKCPGFAGVCSYMTAFVDFLLVICGNWQCAILCEKIAVVNHKKRRVSFMVQYGQRFWGLMLQPLIYILGCDCIQGQGTDFLEFSWPMKFNGIFMTHEIEIIISHFSWPLKPLSVIFMAYGIYNTPTFHGSWTLVPDVSWQFHEPWKPL